MAVKLYHRADEIAMDLTGLDSVGAIDIYYTGKMYAESMFPDDWQVFDRKGRILCVSFGDSFPELLFQYTGLINISGGKVVDRNLKSHPITVIVSGFDYWENITSEFDSDTTRWVDYSRVHTREKGLLGTSIVRNNLTTKPNEFYFEDGVVYHGDYHQHQDGQAMTGGEHQEDSVNIYRKDENGKIFNPRKNKTKRQTIKILKKQIIKEDSIRAITKETKPNINRIRQVSSEYGDFKSPKNTIKSKGTTGSGGGSGGY